MFFGNTESSKQEKDKDRRHLKIPMKLHYDNFKLDNINQTARWCCILVQFA